MTQDELIAELVKREVPLTGQETIKELRQKYKDITAAESTPETGEDSKPILNGNEKEELEQAEEDGEKTKATVVLPNGFKRTYTLREHGKNFLDLAKEFASKRDGEIF